MSRSNVKKPFKSIEYGRKAYLHDAYDSMVNTTPNKGVYDQVLERHSIFEKPYLDGTDSYIPMQEFHRSNYGTPYRDIPFTFSPLGYVDPCADGRTVHATLDGNIAPYHEVLCGTSHTIGMDGGLAPFELSGVAGVLGGSVTDNIYTAPPCDQCGDDVTDHILVSDACGRTPNLIIKTKFPSTDFIQIIGVTEPVDGDCYEVDGGIPPFTWSISAGSISDFGCVAVSGECGAGTITVEDACGTLATMAIILPDTVWNLDSTDTFAPCPDQNNGFCEDISGDSRTLTYYKACGGPTDICNDQCTSVFCDNCSTTQALPCSAFVGTCGGFEPNCWWFKTRVEHYSISCP
jgi:hypothetical protein